MKLCTADEMRQIDRIAIEEYGIPSVVLMECAGRGVVDVIASESENIVGANVVVLCGGGNNGGDGFVIARHLVNRGANVMVFLTVEKTSIRGDALVNFKILQKMELAIEELLSVDHVSHVQKKLEQADVIVDALLGTGLRHDVKSPLRELIVATHLSSGLKIAVDIPSGMSADDGAILGEVFRADHTVTFGYAKLGLVTDPGARYVGKLHVVDIGIPRVLEHSVSFSGTLLTEAMIEDCLKPRPAFGHKGTFGHLMIFGGSRGKTGAVLLASRAALRVGVGLSTIGSPRETLNALESKTVETMLEPLTPDDEEELTESDDAIQYALGLLASKTALVIGPGLGRRMQTGQWVRRLLKNVTIPTVIDADALYAISGDVTALQSLKTPMVLTPHPGEMSMLTGLTTDKIQRDRVSIAKQFSVEHQVYLVLKGSRSVIATPDGNILINPTGNSGMGTAGTGDVLSGMIGGFLAQGYSMLDALQIAIYLHGAAGDDAARQFGEHALNASDVIDSIPTVLKSIER